MKTDINHIQDQVYFVVMSSVKDIPSFKKLISSLLSGTLDKFNSFVEIGSAVCDVGRGSFFARICC